MSIYWSTGNNGSELIEFDTTTGATTVIGPFTLNGVSEVGTYGLAFAPDGSVYTMMGSNATLAKVDLATGHLTLVGGPGGFFGYALDFAPDGTLYAVNVNTNGIFKVNTSTGAFTQVATLNGGASGIMDITFDQSGHMYGVGPSNNLIYSINPTTGASSVAFSTPLGSLMGIATDSDGNLIATSYSSPSQFEKINVTTGQSAIIGAIDAGTSFDHGGDIQIAFNHAPVILTDTTGLQGEIMTPGTYTDGSTATGHNYFANGGSPAATFTATTLNYNLIPGDGDSAQHITTLQQFLNNGGTDGNTLSGDGNLFPASTYFEMKGLFYQAAGQTYSFTLQSDDGSVLYINGQQVLNDDGIHGNGAVTGGTYTATTTGYVPIEFDYFENPFGGASFHATVNGHDFSPADLVRPGTVGGAFTEAANTTGSNVAQTISGNFAFTDQDLTDTHTVSAGSPAISWSNGTVPASVASALASAFSVTLAQNSGASTAGLVDYSFSTADKTFDFLAAGETLTVTYTVTVADNNGGTATQPITFTVTGTNDAPVLSSGAATTSEAANQFGSSANDTATTSVSFTDADLNDHHTIGVSSATSVTWSGGATSSALASALANAFAVNLTSDSTGAGAGHITATFNAPDSAFDFLAAGEHVTATYNVTVDDGHGGTSTQPVTITINGANDVPVLSLAPSAELVVNGGFEQGGAGWSNDGIPGALEVGSPGTYQVSGGFSTGAVMELDTNLRADDVTQTVTTVAGQAYNFSFDTALRAQTPASTNTFEVIWNGQVIDTVNAASNTFERHNYVVTATGGSSVIEFKETGTNDTVGGIIDDVSVNTTAPTIQEATTLTGAATPDQAYQKLLFTDADLTDTHSVSVAAPTVSWSGGSTPSGLVAALTGALTTQLADSAGTGSGSVGATFSAADSTFDFLGAGETLTVTYAVTLKDAAGATSTQPVTITVVGSNDGPVLSAGAAVAQVSGASEATTADLVFTDVDLNDHHTVGTPSLVSASWSAGTVPTSATQALANALSATLATDSTGVGTGHVTASFNADSSAFAFLAAGETLTATYDVSVTDSHGATSTQPVTITIAGANDAPTMTAAAVAQIAELTGATGSSANDQSITLLPFADADLTDTHSVTIGTPAIQVDGGNAPVGLAAQLANALSWAIADSTGTGQGTVTATFNAPDGAFDFLSAGQTMHVTYDVTVDDGHGGTVTQPVQILITGANDAPVLSADTGTHTITELANTTGANGLDGAAGTLNFSDADLNDTHTVTKSLLSAVWSNGPTIPAASLATLTNALTTSLTDSTHLGTGSVGFGINVADKTFDFLGAGETLTLIYNVTVTDSQNVASTQPVKFTVIGTNDAPVLSADPAGNAMNVFAGYNAFQDSSFVTVTNTSGATISNVVLSGVGGLINPTAGHLASTASSASVNLGSLAAGASVTYSFNGSGALHFDFDDFFTGAAKYTVSGTVNGATVSGAFDPFTNATGGFVPFLGNSSSGFEQDSGVASTLMAKIGGAGHPLAELAGQTGSSTADTTSVILNFTDADLTDHHTHSASLSSVSWSGGATLPGGLSTALTAAVSTAINDSTGTGSGNVTLNFSTPDSTFDFLADGETLAIHYNLSIDDGHGGLSSQPVTITVTGTNDAPVLSADTGSHAIIEQAGTANAGSDTASTTLSFTDVDLNDHHTASIGTPAITWSNGANLPANLATTLAGALHTSVTDSTGSGAGSMSAAFSAPDKAFDFLAAGETLTITYDVTVKDNNGATSTQPVTITVTGTNDAPVLAADTGSHGITELAATGNSTADTATTTLAFTDVDLNDTHTPSVGAPSIVWSNGATLPAGLTATLTGALSASVADSTGSGTGSVTASFSAADSTFDFLAAGEKLTVTYEVTVTDNNGASSTQPVTILVTGTNDTPVLAADSGSHAITELAGTANAAADTATTTLAFTDVDLNDTHTPSVGAPSITWSNGSTLPSGLASALTGALTATVSDSTGTGTGSVKAAFSAADSNFDFLAAGETLTVTYDVTVTDNNGAASSQPVTIVVTGTNDTPVLSVDGVASHAITELAGTANATADTATTTLAFTDVDLNDHHSATATTASIVWSGGSALPSGLAAALAGAMSTSTADSTGSGAGTVTATFSAPDSTFDFLAAGETLTITYDVTVKDNNGATSNQPVTVVVTGTNDMPVLSADGVASHAITELAGTGNATADTSATTLAFTDVDLNDHHAATAATASIVWSGGNILPSGLAAALASAMSTSVADSTGTGSGSVTASFSAPDSTFDFLAVGETLTVTYNVTVDDHNGGTSTQPVTVVITGTNDVPVITAGTVAAGAVNELALTTGSSAIDSASGVVNFSDPDLNDRPTATVTNQTVTAHLASGGTFALTAAQTAAFEADFQIAAAAANANTGAINWTFNAQDKTLDFLGVGETVTIVSTVQVDDHHGGAASRDITVTLIGADDAPTTAPDIAGVQKNSSITIDKAHGVLANDIDVDIHDTGMVVSAVNGQAANVGHALQGTYGALTLNADGSYSYVANTKPGALPAGIVAQDTFTYTANDGHGGTTVETLTVSVYDKGQSYAQGAPGVTVVSGGNGQQMLDAGIGTHTLVGGNGPDDLIAGWGSATMTGGAGPDTFVFSHNGFGTATVTDFMAGTDKLQFDHHVLANFSDVIAHAAQVGSNVVITVDANDAITLQGVTLGALHSTDMLFI